MKGALSVVTIFKVDGERYIQVERFSKIYLTAVRNVPLMSEEQKNRVITSLKEKLCEQEKKLCMK